MRPLKARKFNSPAASRQKALTLHFNHQPGLESRLTFTHDRLHMNRVLILGSSSPYRKALLERLGLPFGVSSPDIDETPLAGEPASTLVRRLAESKARALAERHPDALIIGSDQCACLDDRIIGKPGSHERARAQLAEASGRQVVYRTGLCLLDTRSDTAQVEEVVYEVKFRELGSDEIERYLERDQPYNCAGSIRSEALGVSLFEWMRGDDPSALIGLPLIRLAHMLRAAGMQLP